MRTHFLLALLLTLALVALPACQMNERLSGTAIGGVAGAGVGALAGGLGGAVIGGAGGALVGYLVGDYTADGRERGRPSIFGDPADAGCGPCEQPTMYTSRAPSVPSQTPPAAAPAEQTYGYPSMVAGLKVSRGQAAYERGRQAKTADEARRYYEHSLQLDAAQPAVHNALGLHDLLDGNRARAEQRFRTALRYDPTNYAARHNLRRMGF